ncbi:exo-alpha-sialidase [Alginatibacterium sediminis]|uniref:Exo-alpha-sialidase n=1 Tax=Alginatibacterium sediminis TaxID=2164068 RepID=A0A420E6B7_9ALTE|nr:exo-alpha-sialidase [Alginatibacterium sediminis]RKF13207.1 exo-alpha-sialidase [Alginatibacterium sediminis]
MESFVDVARIWDQGEHNAFCDLCVWNDSLVAVFREASAHVSVQGSIRVLQSTDEKSWLSVALLQAESLDYRDPKLTVLTDGRLMMNIAVVNRTGENKGLQSAVLFSKDARNWSDPKTVGLAGDWLWRSTQLSDGIYSMSYQKTTEVNRLYKFDGKDAFDLYLDPMFSKQNNGLGYPNEHAMCLLEDQRALCLLRRDADSSSAQLGIASPPYTDWSWQDLAIAIGGPELCKLSQEVVLAAVRLYEPARTSIAMLDYTNGSLRELFSLPSGGDNSYAGLKLWRGQLYCVYYSSHEQHSSIYCAVISLEGIAQAKACD